MASIPVRRLGNPVALRTVHTQDWPDPDVDVAQDEEVGPSATPTSAGERTSPAHRTARPPPRQPGRRRAPAAHRPVRTLNRSAAAASPGTGLRAADAPDHQGRSRDPDLAVRHPPPPVRTIGGVYPGRPPPPPVPDPQTCRLNGGREQSTASVSHSKGQHQRRERAHPPSIERQCAGGSTCSPARRGRRAYQIALPGRQSTSSSPATRFRGADPLVVHPRGPSSTPDDYESPNSNWSGKPMLGSPRRARPAHRRHIRTC
jgi:hypothetical protein